MGRHYMRVPGVPGDVSVASHKGWIRLSHYAFPNRAPTGRGSSDTKSKPSEMLVTKFVDSASSALQKAAVRGDHFAEVIIESVQGGAVYQRLTLVDVFVTSFQVGTGDPPVEAVGLNFEDMQTEYPTAAGGNSESGTGAAETPAAGKRAAPRAPSRSARVCRCNSQSADAVVLNDTSTYTLRGEVFARLTYARTADEPARFERHKTPRDGAYPLRGVYVRLLEAGMDDDDLGVTQVVTDRDGRFEIRGLRRKMAYTLVAVLAAPDVNLREERVTVSGIRIDGQQGGARVVLTHRNHSGDDRADHIADESEPVHGTFERDGPAGLVLDLFGGDALLFNTFLLDVPHLNQQPAGARPLNIDGIGDVGGEVLCFPTVMAMVNRYYQLGSTAPQHDPHVYRVPPADDPAASHGVATRVYRAWEQLRFVQRSGSDGAERYKFTNEGNTAHVWEWWYWENRAARQAVGLPVPGEYQPKGEIEGRDDLPADGRWGTYRAEGSLLEADQAAYVRRQLGRGWPLVVGTNLTDSRQVVVVRGVVLRQDGAVHKLIVNNPWGAEPGRDAAAYYDGDTRTRRQDRAKLKLTRHLVVRKGIARDEIRERRMLHGDHPGAAGIHAVDSVAPVFSRSERSQRPLRPMQGPVQNVARAAATSDVQGGAGRDEPGLAGALRAGSVPAPERGLSPR